MTAPKSLGRPRPVTVAVGAGGLPVTLGGKRVDSVLEDWLVEDCWWTKRPLRRRYVELVLDPGSCVLVFRDLTTGSWFSQRG